MSSESPNYRLSVERLSECTIPLRIRTQIPFSDIAAQPDLLDTQKISGYNSVYFVSERESRFRMLAYREIETGQEHVAVLKDLRDGEDLPFRVHSSCLTSETFHASTCDCEEQLRISTDIVDREGAGGIIWLNQDGMGNGLPAKLAQINHEFHDNTYDPIVYDGKSFVDRRSYRAAADILRDLGVKSVALITNNDSKVRGIEELGIQVTRKIPCEATALGLDAASYLNFRKEHGYSREEGSK